MELQILKDASGQTAFKLEGRHPITVTASAVPDLASFETIHIRFFDRFADAFFTERKEQLSRKRIELAIFSPETDQSKNAFRVMWSLCSSKISAITSVADRRNASVADRRNASAADRHNAKNTDIYDLGPYFDTVSDWVLAPTLRRVDGISGLWPVHQWLHNGKGGDVVKTFTMHPPEEGTKIPAEDFEKFLLSFFRCGAKPPGYIAKFLHGVVAKDVSEFSITKGGYSLSLDSCVKADGTTKDWTLKCSQNNEEAKSTAKVDQSAPAEKLKIILELDQKKVDN
ncbi:hypothetical protein niasHT_018178 [Heterodera trifolii]|uniref:Uncharacterized protein n=1 Tax=Heterodera trifolii TaxID=157864 RepID=A0ABD2LED7_9BILA